MILLISGVLGIAPTMIFAQEEIKITTIVPSQAAGTVRGVRGAIGSTYKDKTDLEIGSNNFFVEGIVSADDGLVIPRKTQDQENNMTKTTGQLWLNTDII